MTVINLSPCDAAMDAVLCSGDRRPTRPSGHVCQMYEGKAGKIGARFAVPPAVLTRHGSGEGVHGEQVTQGRVSRQLAIDRRQ